MVDQVEYADIWLFAHKNYLYSREILKFIESCESTPSYPKTSILFYNLFVCLFVYLVQNLIAHFKLAHVNRLY